MFVTRRGEGRSGEEGSVRTGALKGNADQYCFHTTTDHVDENNQNLIQINETVQKICTEMYQIFNDMGVVMS